MCEPGFCHSKRISSSHLLFLCTRRLETAAASTQTDTHNCRNSLALAIHSAGKRGGPQSQMAQMDNRNRIGKDSFFPKFNALRAYFPTKTIRTWTYELVVHVDIETVCWHLCSVTASSGQHPPAAASLCQLLGWNWRCLDRYFVPDHNYPFLFCLAMVFHRSN